MKPKIIAMYLPQFHTIPENDKWWGEGYTEWTAVRQAKPMFEGHLQPRVPLNGTYYNLLNKTVMERQSSLMREYGVFGLCFYHYYFGDGRMVLEKPAENLLKWTDIEMPFCFSWANESWVRTWSNFSDERNSWNEMNETRNEGGRHGVLLLQDYGEDDVWERHAEYLIPFFKDSRYIKIDGKPVFLIYKADSIACLPRMKDVWDKVACEHGLKGIYYVTTNSANACCDAGVQMEPMAAMLGGKTLQFQGDYCGVRKVIPYDEAVKCSISRMSPTDQKTFFSVCPGYDDTPRRGSGGTVIHGASPVAFKEYLKRVLYYSESIGNEFVFVNAWNEWGEGNYLEPDELNGESFLSAVKSASEEYHLLAKDDFADRGLKKDGGILEQYRSYWRLFDKWMILKENGIKLKDFFIKRGYNRIAVYGIGMMGRHFLAELPEDMLAYAIDGRADSLNLGLPLFKADDELPATDAIIVTATYDYTSIYNMLKEKVTCPVYSLEEIVDVQRNSLFLNEDV